MKLLFYAAKTYDKKSQVKRFTDVYADTDNMRR